MAPPAHIKRALTSTGVNPTWGLMILGAAQSADVVSALHTVEHCFPLKTAANCVLQGAPCCCKCATWRLIAATEHAQGWPVVPCLMDSTSAAFLCVVIRRLTKFAMSQVTGESVVDGLG